MRLDPACEYLCWCFDESVLYFGRWVEYHLSIKHKTGVNKGNPKYTLQELLSPEQKRKGKSLLGLLASTAGTGFAGPAHM